MAHAEEAVNLGPILTLNTDELRATARRGRITGEVMAVIGSALSAFSIVAAAYEMLGHPADLTECNLELCSGPWSVLLAGAVAQPLGQALTITGVSYWVNNAKLEKRLRPRVTVIPSATGLTLRF